MTAMNSRRSRTPIILVSLLGLGAVATACVLKEHAVEQWYLWEFNEATDFTAKLELAKLLGERRSTKAIPEFVSLLKESDGQNANDVADSRTTAGDFIAGILQNLGPPGIAALSQTLEETKTEKKHWRRCALRALIQADPPEAIPPLIDRLDDEYLCVRLAAVNALGEIGPEANKAIPALREALDSSDHYVHHAAKRALDKIALAPDQARCAFSGPISF